MRPILQNQPQIEGVSWYLLQALKTLIAAIQTGWNKQHNGDGEHTDVTATSLSVTPGTTALGKLNLRTVSYINLGVIPGPRLDNLSVAGLSTASVLKVKTLTGLVNITGIDATGRNVGDLLLLINDDDVIGTPVDISLTALDTNSLAGNRFIGSAASTAPWTLNGSQGVWLMYDTYVNASGSSGPSFGWRVLDRA